MLAAPASGAEAMEAVRSMIARIVLSPAAAGGMEAMLKGDLAQILVICSGSERSNAASGAGVLDVCWRVKCRWMPARITPRLLAADIHAAASHTPKAIIQHTIWLDLRFTLSLRVVAELLAECESIVTAETFRVWLARRAVDCAHCAGQAALSVVIG